MSGRQWRRLATELSSTHRVSTPDLLGSGENPTWADDAPFESVDAWVGRETGLLRQVRTRTSDGVETSYTFTTLRRNVPLADSRFRFSPPAGVEVFDP